MAKIRKKYNPRKLDELIIKSIDIVYIPIREHVYTLKNGIEYTPNRATAEMMSRYCGTISIEYGWLMRDNFGREYQVAEQIVAQNVTHEDLREFLKEKHENLARNKQHQVIPYWVARLGDVTFSTEKIVAFLRKKGAYRDYIAKWEDEKNNKQ